MRDRRPLIIGAATAAALFLVLLALVLLDGREPLAVDLWWQAAVRHLRSPAATAVLTVVSDMSSRLIGKLVVPVAVVVGLLTHRKRVEALTFAVTVASSAVIVWVVKDLVARPRPGVTSLDSFAFPSGHVTNAATVAVLLAVLLSRRWLVALALAWAVVMAVSRTYLGVHWLTDTLAGICLGTFLALLAVLVQDTALRLRAPRTGSERSELFTTNHRGAERRDSADRAQRRGRTIGAPPPGWSTTSTG